MTAQFVLKTYAISTAASPAAGGSVTCTPTLVEHGKNATCTAAPAIGYRLSGWSGDCSGSTCQLASVTGPRSVTAQFVLKTYAISTAASPAAGGSVTCTSNPVTHGSDATCTATPGTGYVFTGWTGDCSGTDACLLSNVTAPHSVTAQFTLKTYAITPVASPAAGGSVTCTPNPVEHGSDATCTATPHAGYRFHAWTGACASQSATCMLSNIEAAQTSTAVFAHEITVPEGPQTGQPIVVTPSLQNHWVIASASSAPISSMATAPPSTVEMPHGIVALQLVAGVVGSDTTVVLTYPEPLPAGTSYYKYGKTKAKPIDHWYKFSGAVISGNTITLTLTDGGAGDNDLAANSLIDDPGGPALLKAPPPVTYSITATASPMAGGAAVCTPSSVSAGGSSTCTATAHAGYSFIGWSGACAGQGATCSLGSISADTSVAASFARTPGAVQSIPTLSEWAMLLLTGLLGLMAATALRRGRSAG